nr:MAG: hypothetical protein DIU60_19520 [Actinomycetota bacterium]
MSDNLLHGAYLTDLAAHLRERGIPEERIGAVIADFSSYLAMTERDANPEAEFGPAADLARRLCADDEETGAATSGTWRWTADIFTDRRRLNEFGAQGWEVETIDQDGMFVSRRDPERPRRWEYRREVVRPSRRAALTASLAADGWEPCGTWYCYAYFKRPLAGPVAAAGLPPVAPRSRVFLGRRFRLLAAAATILLALVVVLIGWWLHTATPIEALDYAAGAIAGAAVALAVGLWLLRRTRAS